MSSNCLSLVKNTIERYQMLSNGDTVIVGLSGGADSVTLLSLLVELKTEYDLHIVAAHVNHGLRGDEAKRDENFSKGICNTLNVPFEVLHVNVPKIAQENNESFETCGRRIRYEFFAKLALKYAGSNLNKVKIATAHNAQDCVETLLLNLVRGCGLSGLLSIPPVRTLDGTGISIIRPIIGLERGTIEKYLLENNLQFVTDSTNLIPDCSRNIIRLNVLPNFECINSGSVANISRCIDTLKEDEEYLEKVASQAINNAKISEDAYYVEQLAMLEKPILSRAMYQIINLYTRKKPEKIHIEMASKLVLDGCGKIQLLTGAYMQVEDKQLKLFQNETSSEVSDFYFEIPNEFDNSNVFTPFSSVHFKIYKNDENFVNNVLENVLDYDKISGNFVLRNRRDGDKFAIPKRNITKSLKNLFNEAKIPVDERKKLSILEVNGEIAYIEKFGPSSKYIATKNTTRFLVLEITRGY